MIRRTVLTVAVLLASTAFAAITPQQIIDAQQAHISEHYLNRRCDFSFFDAANAMPRLHAKGTFWRLGDARRIVVSSQAKDPSGRTRWSEERYLLRDGNLFDNLIGNGVTAPVPQKQIAGRVELLRHWSPWDIELIVAGDGRLSFKELASDPLNTVVVVKATANETVIDINRGPSRWMTFWLDPANGYVVTRMRTNLNPSFVVDRTMRYENGLLVGSKHRSPTINYDTEIKWTGEATDRDMVIDAITAEGDIVIDQATPDAPKETFKVRDGVLVPDAGIATDVRRVGVAGGVVVKEFTPADAAANAATQPQPKPIDPTDDTLSTVLGFAALASLVALLVGLVVTLFKKNA